MSVDIQIESLSVAEKVQLLESVWESLCAHPGDVQSPEWHREVLKSAGVGSRMVARRSPPGPMPRPG